MAADRHDDRRETLEPTEQSLTDARRPHVREAVGTTVANIRARAARGTAAADAGHGIDAHFDRIASSNEMHTRDAPGQTRAGDGLTGDNLRSALEAHRREMQLAAISRHAGGTRPADATGPETRTAALPPREAAKRDPRHPESPGRASVTTVFQKSSYGPQDFARTDVMDRPNSMPTIARGGGADFPPPPVAPTPALGHAAALERERGAPQHSR